MKPVGKYVQLLEKELEYLRELLGQARKDLEFYRGKCERLELSLMNNTPAQQSYAARTDIPAKADIRERKFTEMTQRLPFSEIKRRWNQMSAEAQEKAIAEGWNVDAEPKEETNAGK